MYENKFTTVDFENHKPKFAGTLKEILGVTFWQYNKSFIDQACLVEMAEYWPRSFFCVFMDLDFVSLHKSAKKELGQYPAILTSRLVNNAYIIAMKKTLCRYSTNIFYSERIDSSSVAIYRHKNEVGSIVLPRNPLHRKRCRVTLQPCRIDWIDQLEGDTGVPRV